MIKFQTQEDINKLYNMSITMKNSKNRYKIVLIICLIGIIGLSVLVYVTYAQLQDYKSSDLVPSSTVEHLKTKIDLYQRLSDIDELWMLDKQPQKALSLLKEMDMLGSPLKPRIETRIKRLNQVLQSQNDDELTKINLRTALSQANEALDSLVFTLDSTKQNYRLTTNELKLQNDSLEIELVNKEKQLKRKETLQVISFQSNEGIKVYYLGEIQDSKANGGGVGVWTNGSIYRGEWKNNRRHGKGEFTWPDGASYEGEFVMGERTGEGTFQYITGEEYRGEFQSGLRSGQGTLYDVDGNISFEGLWKNDKPQN